MRHLRRATSSQLPIKDDWILWSIKKARDNWSKWSDVFDHKATVATNPLLASEPKFREFCEEYSVGRTIRRGTRDKLRRKLIDLLPSVVKERDGGSLDKLEKRLRHHFGTHTPPRRITSAVSKVAAFVKPERFVAWDQYAKEGLNIVLARSRSSSFESYEDYLKGFDQVWRGQLGGRIRHVAGKLGSARIERQARFLRRVLDVYLMKLGDREF